MAEKKIKKTIKKTIKKKASSSCALKKKTVSSVRKKRTVKKETVKVRILGTTSKKLASLGTAVLGSFVDPKKIISGLDVKEGMKVADLGAGTGYFAFPLARRIGDSGVLFAVDVVNEKLEAVESQAKIFGISNIVTLRGNLLERKGSGLPGAVADWAFLVNVLFQNKDKMPIISETLRVLKKGGRVMVLEWDKKRSPIGPGLRLRVSKDEVEDMFEKSGFRLEKEIDVGDFHYGLIFVK